MTNEKLCQLIGDGDCDELIPVLWEKTSRLFYMVAQRMYSAQRDRAIQCGVEWDDIKSECYLAFLSTLKAYNAKAQNAQFNTFINFHVKNTVNALLGYRRRSEDILNIADSLDKPIGEDDGELTLCDVAADDTALAAYEEIEKADVERTIREAVDTLPEQLKQVVTEHYFSGRTYTAIAEDLDVSANYAAQLSHKALRRLRRLKILRELSEDICSYPCGFSAFKRTGLSCVEQSVDKRMELDERIKGFYGEYVQAL